MENGEHKHCRGEHCHDEHCHEHDGCGCESCRKVQNLMSEEEEKEGGAAKIILIIASLILLVLGFLPLFGENIRLAFFVLSAILSGYELIPEAIEELKEKKLDENLLVLIAIVAAFCIGEGAEAAFVSLFFRIGESLEDYSVDKSKKAIRRLYDITSEKAVVLDSDGASHEIDAKQVKCGDLLLVSPFEKVPVDCVATEDGGSVDASAITGESVPVELKKGTSVLSSSVNGSTAIKLRAVSEFENSAASRIIKTVEESNKNKGKTDKFITRFARVYTPTVVILAVLLAVIPSLVTGNWAEYIHRALVFLVASCPCALVLSIPLGFFAGIGAQSKCGIIVKGGKYVEEIAKADTFLFDKTGTLTDSSFDIDGITALDGYTEEDVLKYAAYAEKYSTHPLSQAIKKASPDIDESRISGFKESGGNGTSVLYDKKEIICGKREFLKENGIEFPEGLSGQIFVGFDRKAAGVIRLSGHVRESTVPAIKELRRLGAKKLIMLTGDNEEAAREIADKCSLDGFEASMLPEEKTEYLKRLKKQSGKIAFVGDGINDTPTLSQADVGVAMGSGTAAAIETGDIVLMNSDLSSLVKSVKISRHTMRVVRWNIGFAIAVKLAVLILGALGFAPMWAAIFADVGVCIIDVLNSTRLLLDGK